MLLPMRALMTLLLHLCFTIYRNVSCSSSESPQEAKLIEDASTSGTTDGAELFDSFAEFDRHRPDPVPSAWSQEHIEAAAAAALRCKENPGT